MRAPWPNFILQGDGFYGSYNNRDALAFGSDTTAIVPDDTSSFYVLNGDHREQYRPLIEKGFDACIEYFNAHADQKNKYSDTP